MSPEPYVRGQAAVLAILLIGAAAVGSPLAALVLAGVGALVVFGLRTKYRGDVAAAGTPTPRHRERLDLIVSGDARAALGAGLVAGGLLVALGIGARDIGAAAATPVLLAGSAIGVYLSSLVDWYVILPRISGQLGVRPCRDEHSRHPRFPRTWRESTRWWFIHRIAAALILRFGLSFAVAFTIKRYVTFPGGSFVVATIAVAGFASYRAAAFRAFFEAGHPTFIVGRTVRCAKAKRQPLRTLKLGRRTFRIPGLKKEAVGDHGPRMYVYDVALECVQLARVADREREVPRDSDDKVVFESDPEKVLLKDIGAVKPGTPFAGCEGRCSGINWYCIENPRCFEPK